MKYKAPIISIYEFETENVITTSTGTDMAKAESEAESVVANYLNGQSKTAERVAQILEFNF